MDRLKDFLIGFLGGGFTLGILSSILVFLFEVFSPVNYSDSYEIVSIFGSIILVIGLIIFGAYYFFKMDRKWIGYGLISLFGVPFVLIFILVFSFRGYLF